MGGLPPWSADVAELSPEEFERLVLQQFERSGDVSNFEIAHREIHRADDGTYEIDLTLRFSAFDGPEYMTLIECKHHRNPIKRDLLMILNQKKESLHAHKAILCASIGFQSGALEFAREHGIATARVVEGRFVWETKARFHVDPPPGFPRFHLHLYESSPQGVSVRLLERDGSDLLPHVLGIASSGSGTATGSHAEALRRQIEAAEDE